MRCIQGRTVDSVGLVTFVHPGPTPSSLEAPMWPIFEQSLARFQELETQLGDPVVVANRNLYTKTAKEHGALAKQVKPYLEYKKVVEDISQAEAMIAAESDPEMKQYAEQELVGLRTRRDVLHKQARRFRAVRRRKLRQHHHGNPRRHGRR